MHATIQKFLVRSEKPVYFLAKEFISKTTGKDKIKRDKLITQRELVVFEKHKDIVGSKFCYDFRSVQKQLTQISKSERLKWNYINEFRFYSKTAQSIETLRNSFDEVLTESKQTNLLSYNNIKLGDVFQHPPP